jgi:hypothetical protein
MPFVRKLLPGRALTAILFFFVCKIFNRKPPLAPVLRPPVKMFVLFDEMSDGIVVRLGIPGKRFYSNIGFAGLCYGPAGDNSA